MSIEDLRRIFQVEHHNDGEYTEHDKLTFLQFLCKSLSGVLFICRFRYQKGFGLRALCLVTVTHNI